MTTQPNDKPRILIVDDLPENIRILIELLGVEYATIPATSGAVALKKAQAEPLPDLILLDIMMPEMDGYDVCRALKESAECRSMPCTYSTYYHSGNAWSTGRYGYSPL